MDLIESYREDLQLIRNRWTRIWVGALVIAIFLFPLYGPEHYVYKATLIAIFSVGALGQNLLIGYTGQISFGQAGFLAVGAYTFGHLARAGVPWPLALVAAGLVAGGFGIIVGFPSLRLKGPYLAIATMGFGIATYQVFANSEVISGGRMGLTIPKLDSVHQNLIASLGISAGAFNYYVCLLFALLFTLATYNIVSSYMGRAFIAIRDNDIAAEVVGVSLTRYKLLSFGVSSFYTGIQGGLYAMFLGFLEPQMFTFMEAVTLFVAVIIGGLASVEGSIMGAAFVVLVPHWLTSFKAMVPVVFGAVIIFTLVFEPLGIYGRWMKIRLYLQNWPFR
jgi:branched-chain amino acid transport system permease protein